jgi:glycerophosphoryl diester phosphodiesterase
MKRARERNLPVTIWTADNPRLAQRVFDLGIFTVVTNHPTRLLAKRKEILQKNWERNNAPNF